MHKAWRADAGNGMIVIGGGKAGYAPVGFL